MGVCYLFRRSMSICMNKSTRVTLTVAVPPSGIRHGWLVAGCAFNLALSKSYRDQRPATNLETPEAGR